MDKNTQLKQPKNETTITPVMFWGAIVLGSVIALLAAYTLSIAIRAPRTIPNMVGIISYFLILAGSITSIVLTSRGRQALGAQVEIYSTLMLGIVTVGLTQGRAATASFSILLITVVSILGLFPQEKRRGYFAISGAAFALMWIIEWVNPSWRLVNEAAKIGPAAAIVFAIILVAIVARQTWGGNIRTKLVTSFTMIALISVAIVGTVVYISYRNQVREDIRQRLLNIASITATQLDGDLHATLQTAEDMQTEAYRQMMAQGDEIVATDPTLKYSYTMRMNDQGQIYFILDSRQADDTERVNIGTVYEEPSETLLAYFNAPDRPIVEQEIYTDEFGSVLSAFAPFYRADGSLEGIFGVDIAADIVLDQERAILFLILGTTLGTMVLVTLIGLFLGNLFVVPVINLSAVAKKIANGDLSARAKIETTDEIGELATDFNIMTSQLQETLQGLEQRVADRTRNLELASEVGRSVSQVGALDVILKNAVDIIRSRFDLYYVQVYLADPAQTNLLLLSGTGKVGAELLSRSHRLPLNTGSINGRAATEKRSVVITDTTASATFRPNPLLPNTRSEMAVPLLVGEKVVGVLDLQSEQANSLNQEILPAFEALAGQLAIAIQNANLLAETNQARAELEAQARRLSRANWADYMDAIHKPEETGFVFEQNEISTMTQDEAIKENSLVAPIAVTGESLGNLVVEMGTQSQGTRSADLVNTIALQVSQRIENLRLLESAERYRAESEEASRRLTREGWKTYVENTDENLSYFYDLKEVRPHAENGHTESVTSVPLKVREEILGRLAIQGLDINDSQALELANAVAERLSAHIEGLRQFDETRRGQIELDKRAQQLAAVAEISTVSSKELNTQKMLESVVQLTQRQFGLYHAHIFTFDEVTATLQIAACGWRADDANEGTHETVSIPLDREQSLVARAARTKQAVIVNNVRQEAGWLPNPLLPDTVSEMAVPLVVGDQVLGVLDVQSNIVNAFTAEDANIQTTLASQVATALQNARSFARAQQQADRESTLNVISQKIQSATTVEAVLQIAARELGHALGAPMTVAQLSMKDKS